MSVILIASDSAQSELGLTGCATSCRFSQRPDYIYVDASETDPICVSVVRLKKKKKENEKIFETVLFPGLLAGFLGWNIQADRIRT